MNSRSGCLREFEETGFRPAGILDPLGEAIQAEARGSQRLRWPAISIPLVSRVYPAKSNGHRRVNGSCVPEVDRAAWFTLDEARVKIIKGQGVFLDRLEQILRRDILYVEEEL